MKILKLRNNILTEESFTPEPVVPKTEPIGLGRLKRADYIAKDLKSMGINAEVTVNGSKIDIRAQSFSPSEKSKIEAYLKSGLIQ